MTRQPSWKFVDNLGDATPLDYGGYFVYVDTTGVYGPEAELLEEPEGGNVYTVRRILLERCKQVEAGDRVLLVPFKYDDTWPHPVESYDEWFSSDLREVADCVGMPVAELRDMLCSDDPLKRADAYRAIGDYHGWDNLDEYPLILTEDEVRSRYKQGELEYRRGGAV